MFTVSARALETGGAANETPSFLIVLLVKPGLINAARLPVCEQSTWDSRRADDSQWSAAPSHHAERTFGLRWRRSASENRLPECFCSSLRPSADRGRGLSCSQRMVRETGRSGGGMEALKFLMRSLVFSLPNLHTSCLWAGWNNQAHQATHTDKLPPLAPPRASVCHHSRRVPRPCFCGDMEILCPPPFSFCLYSTEVGWWSLKAGGGAVVKENWPSTYKYPASSFHLKAESPTMQKSCCRGRACVGEAYTLSAAYMSFNRVFVLGTTPPHPPTPAGDVRGGTDTSTDGSSLQRQDVEVEEVVLVWPIYDSHTFSMDYEKLWALQGKTRTASGALPKF